MRPAPPARLRALNEAPLRPEGSHILYWMVGFRRPRWNFALEHAASLADSLGKPLVVLEALRVGYPWASDRFHQFILDGMRANAGYFAKKNVFHFPYVEATAGEGRGLLSKLAEDACVIVSDDYPAFFIPRMQAAAASRLDTRVEVVDGNGLFPIRATDKVFSRAFDFRRHLQRELPTYLDTQPLADPVDGLAPIPEKARQGLAALAGKRWPGASEDVLLGKTLASLCIDHEVPAVDLIGGFKAGEARIHEFFAGDIDRYGEERSHPDAQVASGLSPWLHFGHVSTHQIFDELTKNEGWSPDQLSTKVNGAREGWWGMSSTAESFIDELVTWREVGFNMCAHRNDYDQYESLPAWARESLELHESDERAYLYSLEQLAASETHDPIWNAAQTELRETGRLQNYLRMLWGKKILEWSPTAREALATMIELNNKYALDGRDPNSYSGIFWVLGRYDRAWGPERPIFGKIRYMSSENTKRKLRMSAYLDRFGDQASLLS
ncbi:MAG: deoxyribodipyrimidine photolyase [Myxococcales bacterium]|nr:deoxyribodipyrimidine photolyase [Myxococcales bacterium]